MNILLIGSGGREHALAFKIKQSQLCNQLFIAPGNPGTAQHGINIDIQTTDFRTLGNFCIENEINMMVVGPEDSLVNGIYDFFKADQLLSDIIVVGPSAKAAQLEGSKAFAKSFMKRHGIPTASYREFSNANFDEGVEYIQGHSLPIVLKADGLAAGKGVVIAETHEDALEAFKNMIKLSQFGKASERVVVESFLKGVELSVFALTNGKEFVLLPEAKDYKRIGDGDKGPNTGGMGAISPVPFADKFFMQKVLDKVVIPTIKGIDMEGLVYHGFVFFGLIKVGNEPYVIEYNCRMGDPETEVVMPRLSSDLVEMFIAMEKGDLDQYEVKVDPRAAATVVLVSGGYPNAFEKGKKIDGLNQANDENTIAFHAGILDQKGVLLSNGGRVAAITSYGNTIQEAVVASLKKIEGIHFDNMNYRRDIGYEFA